MILLNSVIIRVPDFVGVTVVRPIFRKFKGRTETTVVSHGVGTLFCGIYLLETPRHKVGTNELLTVRLERSEAFIFRQINLKDIFSLDTLMGNKV